VRDILIPLRGKTGDYLTRVTNKTRKLRKNTDTFKKSVRAVHRLYVRGDAIKKGEQVGCTGALGVVWAEKLGRKLS